MLAQRHLFSLVIFSLALGLGGCNVAEQSKKPFRAVGTGLSKTGHALKGTGQKVNPFRDQDGGTSQPKPTGTTAAPPSKPDRAKRKKYYVVETNGMRRSRGIRTRHYSRYRRQPCIVSDTYQETKLSRGGKIFTSVLRRKIITGLNGAAYYAQETRLSGGEKKTETVTIWNGKAAFSANGPAGSTQNVIDVPPNVAFGIEPSWLIGQRLHPGAHFKVTVLSRSSQKLMPEEAVVTEQKNMLVEGIQTPVWVVAFGQPEAEDTPVTMTFTTTSDLVRLKVDTTLIRMVSKAEYQREVAPATVNSNVKHDFILPAWDQFSVLVFSPKNPTRWRKYLKTTEYQEIRDDGTRVEIALRSPLRGSRKQIRSARLPMAMPDNIRPYLDSGPSIFPKNRTIRDRARRIIGNETNVIQTLARLAGWVHGNIRFASSAALNPSPLATLSSRAGDCSEHADLFSSLARSIGVPTRICQGLTTNNNKLVYHAWAEAWVAGQWVAVDTTVNRVGLTAGYLLTARSGADGVALDRFGGALQQGGLDLQLVAAHKDRLSPTGKWKRYSLYPGQKRTYIVREGDWMENLLWGFSLRRPAAPGWRNEIKLNQVIFRKGNIGARITVEGLSNQVRVNGNDLDRIVANLQKTFKGAFRKHDAALVSFQFGQLHPPRPAAAPAPALMLDFSFVSGGVTFRCLQYIIPRNGRSYRLTCLAPTDRFAEILPDFKRLLKTIEL